MLYYYGHRSDTPQNNLFCVTNHESFKHVVYYHIIIITPPVTTPLRCRSVRLSPTTISTVDVFAARSHRRRRVASARDRRCLSAAACPPLLVRPPERPARAPPRVVKRRCHPASPCVRCPALGRRPANASPLPPFPPPPPPPPPPPLLLTTGKKNRALSTIAPLPMVSSRGRCGVVPS